MLPETKKWIDEATYEQLLRNWRFAPVGSPYFIGETGQYYEKVMREKQAAIGAKAAQASKTLG